ncbi:MAG TPA: hypothetical protein VJ572_03495, partial [Azonexus sp.]|nr:hypothetical protein [Azonexus sp.]
MSRRPGHQAGRCCPKAWCGIFSLAIAIGAWSQDSTFSTSFGTAVLCLDDLAPGYFYDTMRQHQRPYKTDDGAYWFKTTEQLFGAPLTEV